MGVEFFNGVFGKIELLFWNGGTIMNKKMLRLLMALALVFTMIPGTAFAAVVPADGTVEPEGVWYREDVVTESSGTLYSDDMLASVYYEETKTEVYHVNRLTGRKELQHIVYETVWTGYTRDSVNDPWEISPDHINVYEKTIDRGILDTLLGSLLH